MLTVIDEFSRKCLVIKFGYNLASDNIIDLLSDLFINEAIPDFIHSDNGSEFTARTLQDWLKVLKVKTDYILLVAPKKMVLMKGLMVALEMKY